jgi:hypothetical protein
LIKSKDGEPIGGHLFKRECGGADDYSNVVTWSGTSEKQYTVYEYQYLERAKTDASDRGRGRRGVSRGVNTKARFLDFKVNLDNISLPDKQGDDGSVIKDRTIGSEKSKSKGRRPYWLLLKLIQGAIESIPNSVEVSTKGLETWARTGKQTIMNVNEKIEQKQVATQFEFLMEGISDPQIERAVAKLDTMK